LIDEDKLNSMHISENNFNLIQFDYLKITDFFYQNSNTTSHCYENELMIKRLKGKWVTFLLVY